MGKISVAPSNDFCPQTLFLLGTYKDDGEPNYGLFCWLSYTWYSEMGVMVCIGGSKLTKDRVRETKRFSANLVTEAMLPMADYCGSVFGRDGGKRSFSELTERGSALGVPVLTTSPWSFELEVKGSVELDDSTVFLCSVANTLADDYLINSDDAVEAKLAKIRPVSTTCATYFSWDGKKLGGWGEMHDNCAF